MTTVSEPLHILVLATAVSPWILTGDRWIRHFQDSDTENVFVLLGPKLRHAR